MDDRRSEQVEASGNPEADIRESERPSDVLLDVDAILEALQTACPGTLPTEAIRSAQQQPEAVTPRLLEVLKDAISQHRAGDTPEGDAHLIALYLLVEFETPEVLPLILELFALADDGADMLFGDALNDDGARMLAMLVDERTEAIDELIRNPNLDMFRRWTAAAVFPQLVLNGKLTREAAAARLEEHLRWAIDVGDEEATTGLVDALCNLAVPSSLPLIKRAFEAELIDDSMINWPEIEKEFKAGDERYLEWRSTEPTSRIQDTVAELREWYYFSREKSDDEDLDDDDSGYEEYFLHPPGTAADERFSEADLYEVSPAPQSPPGTIRNQVERVGRNELCPCGSGEKYKKCCGRP